MPVLGTLVVTRSVAPTGICGAAIRPLNAATPAKEVTRGWSPVPVEWGGRRGGNEDTPPPVTMSPRVRKVAPPTPPPTPPETYIGVVDGSAFKTGDALRFSSLTTSLANETPPEVDAAPEARPTPRIERNGNDAVKEFDAGRPTALEAAPIRRAPPAGFSAIVVAPGEGEGVTAIVG